MFAEALSTGPCDTADLIAHLRFDKACAVPTAFVSNVISATALAAGASNSGVSTLAGRCRLTLSNPR
jgi:hypothetical protein